MSDEQVRLESAAAPEVQQRAMAVGWVPPEKYRGDPDRFVDAPAFLEHADQVMPILRKNNQELHATIVRQNADIASLRTSFDEARETIEALKEFSEESAKRAAEQTKRDILSQIRAAKEAGNIDAEVELTEQLSDINAELRKPPEKKEETKTATPAANQPSPEFLAWHSENSWYGKDARRTSVMNAIAAEMRQDPAHKGLLGRAFLDAVAAEVEATMSPAKPPSKTEGSKGGGAGGSSGGSGGGKGYNSLPADARAQCDADSKRFVGANRAFKTSDEWRAHYAKVYFKSEGV